MQGVFETVTLSLVLFLPAQPPPHEARDGYDSLGWVRMEPRASSLCYTSPGGNSMGAHEGFTSYGSFVRALMVELRRGLQ